MQSTPLRITIAEDDDAFAYALRKELELIGCKPVSVARSHDELIERSRLDRPDLILADIRLAPGDGIDAAEAVYREQKLPIIILSSHFDSELLARVQSSHALAYLTKPIERPALHAAIGLATSTFKQMCKLDQENQDLAKQLEERKTIERAKGILIAMLRIEEEDAYRRMRKFASDRNLKLVQVARQIIESEEPFREMRLLDNGVETAAARTRVKTRASREA